MKLLKTLTIALLTASASASLFKTNIMDAWDVNDLKQYLKDNSIPFDEKKATIDQLKELTKKQYELRNRQQNQEPSWYHPDSLKQRVLNLYQGASDAMPSTSVDTPSYIDYNTIKDWVFTTWSAKELEKLLTKAGVKYEPTSKRSELIKIAQKHYDDIAKSSKASGKYPGDWLYSNWDKKDLKKWLDDYGVDYKSLRDSKDDLVRKVRENTYRASKYSEEEKNSVLDSLGLADQSLFDKAGSIRDDVFEAWTASQLYKWLKSQKIDIDAKMANNKAELAAVAAKYKDELKSDIDSWTTQASQKASPYLEKGSKKADNVINDTFFVGIESWSRDRLKAFLESRDVRIPLFATKYELIELVKQNKYKPIKNFDSKWFFEGWSKENVQKWLQEQSNVASQGSKDVWGKANDLYKTFVESLFHYSSKASDAVSDAYDTASDHLSNAGEKISDLSKSKSKNSKDAFFDYWSDLELKKYLATFGIYNTKKTRREDLLDMAKKNTLWFVGGASNEAQGTYASTKLASLNAYNYAVMMVKNWCNHLRYALFGKV